jgi:hypothetical protein
MFLCLGQDSKNVIAGLVAEIKRFWYSEKMLKEDFQQKLEDATGKEWDQLAY